MTGLEAAVQEVTQDWRIRLAAATDLLTLVNEELAEMQETVNRIPGGAR